MKVQISKTNKVCTIFKNKNTNFSLIAWKGKNGENCTKKEACMRGKRGTQ